MATYKLIQDIEAEDKILGPLTLRQFIFALISLFLFYICFILLTKHVAFLLAIFLPPALFFGFFAMPFGRDQPTEVWALAKLRFWFKPRKRIWNQSGVKELVTINAPKRIEHIYTNGLSQGEVRSRLSALANTIDSRGWAVKNVNVNAYAAPAMMAPSSDRLLDMSSMPQEVQDTSILPADDILDETNNPIAQQFDSMINRSSQEHRQQLVDQLNGPAKPVAPADDYWFMNGGQTVQVPVTPVAQITSTEEAALASQLKSQSASRPAPYGNLRTLQPASTSPKPVSPPVPNNQFTPVTPTDDPAIISLANNDDLDVATLAREAKRKKGDDDRLQDNEVVISLR